MVRLFHAILTGLVGAALLHVVIILMLPKFVTAGAYARVAVLGPPGRFHALPIEGTARPPSPAARAETGVAGSAPGADAPPPLARTDPFLPAAACIVSLDQGPVRLYAEGDVPFWSVVVFDRDSNEVFSMNDRTSVSGALDMLLGTTGQLPQIRKALPEELSESILVEMPPSGGYAVLRAFAPRPSFEAAVTEFLSGAECDLFRPGE